MAPPPPAQRPATGPLPPPPQRLSAPIPPVLTRTTGSLPPPPLRPSVGAMPSPRASSGTLPTLSMKEPLSGEGSDDAPAAPDFPAPAASSLEKNPIRPSVPLPDFKPLFGYDEPVVPAETEEKETDSAPSKDASSSWFEANQSEPPSSEERTSALGFDPANVPIESTDLTEEAEEPVDDKKRLEELEEKLSLVTEERDQSRAELEIIRQKLDAGSKANPGEDAEQAARERDEARLEVIVLRSQLEAAEQTQRDTAAMASQLEELSHVIDERDSVRRDYAVLREQFETLKLDRSRGDATATIEALEEENRKLREQVSKAKTPSAGGGDEPVSADVATLREELKKAREEASMSSRGLALSQKALLETREALKVANEGASLAKGSPDDQKKERAALVRQNMLLQGQNEQLTRELSAAKAKLGAKDT
jgi:hypothetical protein